MPTDILPSQPSGGPAPADTPTAPAAGPFRRLLVHPGTHVAEDAATALVRRAVRLARRTGATVTLVDVLPEVSGLARRLLPAGVELPALLREECQRRLDALARPARRAGVAVEVALLEGSRGVALVREVLRGGHDVLMLPAGAPGVTALGVHLVRKAPCPVWLLPADAPARRPRRPRVLAAVDLPDVLDAADVGASAAGREVRALAHRILDAAAALAGAEDGELHVLHAWTAYGETALRHRALGALSAAEIERYVLGFERQARAALDAVLAPVRPALAAAHVHLVKGSPDDVLPAAVRAFSVDTLVLGTVARSGLSGLLIGNTAERLVEAPPCGVLVVKPPGFVSPVTPG